MFLIYTKTIKTLEQFIVPSPSFDFRYSSQKSLISSLRIKHELGIFKKKTNLDRKLETVYRKGSGHYSKKERYCVHTNFYFLFTS
jgi:hypothetical protein